MRDGRKERKKVGGNGEEKNPLPVMNSNCLSQSSGHGITVLQLFEHNALIEQICMETD